MDKPSSRWHILGWFIDDLSGLFRWYVACTFMKWYYRSGARHEKNTSTAKPESALGIFEGNLSYLCQISTKRII